MALPGVPSNFTVQAANQQILASWDQVLNATSYVVERSEDNITFTALATISGSPLANSYLDTTPVLGTTYWYRAAAVNGTGQGAYTSALANQATISGEMTLAQIRLAAMQRADMVGSTFVSNPEWRNYINQSMFELYDLLVTTYEDYFVTTPVQFNTNGAQFIYPLPNGQITFQSGINPTQNVVAPPFYKLVGVDLALNTASNGYVTVNKFNFSDRNRFVYPNQASTIYGVFNLQYRIMGTNTIEFIPTPSANQQIRLWYIPRLTELLQDTDTTQMGISGWIEYVIVKAAYYALTKQEQPTQDLVMQLAALQKRIEETAVNRDAGQPDTISTVSRGPWSNGWVGPNGRAGF